MKTYYLPMIEESHAAVFLILFLVLGAMTVGLTSFFAKNYLFNKQKFKLSSLTQSIGSYSMIAIMAVLAVSTINNIVVGFSSTSPSQMFEQQLVKENPEINNMHFMVGGPIDGVSAGDSPKPSPVLECYNDSKVGEIGKGYIKDSGINYHAVIKRTNVDADKQLCEYEVVIGEKVEEVKNTEPLDGLPVG